MQKSLLSFFSRAPGTKPAAPATAAEKSTEEGGKAVDTKGTQSPPANASPSRPAAAPKPSIAPSAPAPASESKKRPLDDVKGTDKSAGSASKPKGNTPAKASTAKKATPASAKKSPKTKGSSAPPAKRRVLADSDDEAVSADEESGSESGSEGVHFCCSCEIVCLMQDYD